MFNTFLTSVIYTKQLMENEEIRDICPEIHVENKSNCLLYGEGKWQSLVNMLYLLLL